MAEPLHPANAGHSLTIIREVYVPTHDINGGAVASYHPGNRMRTARARPGGPS